MAKVMLGKYFNRREDWDFSDDGTRFRCYECNGVEISYAKTSYGIYLSAHLSNLFDHELLNFDKAYYNLYLKACNASDKYNTGCSDISADDLAVWKDDLLFYIDQIKNYILEKPIIYYNELDKKYYGYCYCKEYSWGDVVKKLQVCSPSNLNKFVVKYLKVVDNL